MTNDEVKHFDVGRRKMLLQKTGNYIWLGNIDSLIKEDSSYFFDTSPVYDEHRRHFSHTLPHTPSYTHKYHGGSIEIEIEKEGRVQFVFE